MDGIHHQVESQERKRQQFPSMPSRRAAVGRAGCSGHESRHHGGITISFARITAARARVQLMWLAHGRPWAVVTHWSGGLLG